MTFQNPYAMLHIRDGIKAYLENQGLHDMRELIGKLQVD